MKKILILITLIFTLTLAGCSKKAPDLHQAISNMQRVTSMESETEISFNLETIGLSKDDQEEFLEIADMLNNLVFKFTHKFKTDEKLKQSLSESVFNIDVGGVAFNTRVFNEVDLANESIKLVVEVPQALKDLIPFLSLDKKYLVLDLNETLKDEEDLEEDVSFDSLVKHQKESHAKIIELSKEIEKELKPGFDIIIKNDDVEFIGEKHSSFTLKLDDATFKELLRKYMNIILADEDLKAEINLEDDLSVEEFNEIMDELDKIQIIGDENVVIKYLVNKDGFIAKVDGKIDILIDFDNLRENLDEEIESVGKINLKINFTTTNKNINSKDVVVEIPELNEDNSMGLEDLFNFGSIFDDFDYDFDDDYDFDFGDFDFDTYLEGIGLIYDLYYDDIIDENLLDELIDEFDELESSEDLKAFIEMLKDKYK